MAIITVEFEEVDVSVDVFTESKNIPPNIGIVITPNSATVVGSPLYTLQCSNDDVNWFDYNHGTENISLADAMQFDFTYKFLFMRFSITSLGSTGLASFIVNIER